MASSQFRFTLTSTDGTISFSEKADGVVEVYWHAFNRNDRAWAVSGAKMRAFAAEVAAGKPGIYELHLGGTDDKLRCKVFQDQLPLQFIWLAQSICFPRYETERLSRAFKGYLEPNNRILVGGIEGGPIFGL